MLAAAHGRIASVSALGLDYLDLIPQNTSVQIRNGSTGALVTTVQPAGTIRAVALSSRLAAVLVEATGPHVQWYSLADGHRVGSIPLACGALPILGMNGDGRRIL
jgi:hypothetical protein